MQGAVRTAIVMLALAGALGACDGTGATTPTNAETATAAPTPPEELNPYRFQLDGPRPFNETVYYATGDAIDADAAYEGAILNPGGLFVVRGPEGAPYHIRSEPKASAAERLMLWMVQARGVLGEGLTDITAEAIRVGSPRRSLIRFAAPGGAPGPDSVTLFHEETRSRATAYRDPRHAYFLAIWDDDEGHAYRHHAPPRPWEINDFAAGEYVIGAHTEGRQWAAWRGALSPDKPFEIDSGAQPSGGGTLICEEANALLLLNSDLAIPAPRITAKLQYRSVWKGVPPGKHSVRYPDGREVEIDVEDGKELKLGK